MKEKALIYIPDISGFTKFVTETEISHSQHIISELIEIILENNKLNFKASEVEGDAVLFYKIGDVPSLLDLINQSKKMFIKFHEHLKIIQRDNVCHCGACQTASNLSLKFICHYGELKEISVRQFNKIMGSAVILSHRLLKNTISSREYLLVTESYINTQNVAIDDYSEDNTKFLEYVEEINNFGTIKTKYFLLSHLKKNINYSIEKKISESIDINNFKSVITINAPIESVHEKLIDLDSKIKWVPGIKNVITKDKINRVNTTHSCVFENNSMNLKTLESKKNNNTIKYSELLEVKKNIYFTIDYFLYSIGNETKLAHFIELPNYDIIGNEEKINFFYRMKSIIILPFFRQRYKNILYQFKRYCEE